VQTDQKSEVFVAGLINGLIARDDNSWRQFLLMIGPIVTNICIKAGMNEDETDDIAQMFVVKLLAKNCKALRNLDLRGKDSFFGWLKVGISHLAIDQVKKNKASDKRSKIWIRNLWLDNDKTLTEFDSLDREILLDQAYAAMTPSEQVLFRLEMGGLSDAEIGRFLGLGIPAVEQRLSRMRKKLKRVLTGRADNAK
jgi:RNA polymerase sigma factor (sigma-70 family)